MLLSLLLAGSEGLVEGDLECPTAQMVEAELRSLLNPNAIVDEMVRLSETDSGLVAELRDRDGALIDARQFEAVGSCEEQARTVGVVLSIWIGQIHPSVLLPVAQPRGQAPGDETSDAEPSKPPATEPVETAPVPAPQYPGTTAGGARPPPWDGAHDVGVGLLASLASKEPSLGLLGQFNLIVPRPGALRESPTLSAWTGFGVHASVAADLGRSVDVPGNLQGPVRFDWNRFPLAVGPLAQFRVAGVRIEGRLVAVPTVVWARGAAELPAAQPSSDTAFSLGYGAGIRAIGAERRWITWLDLSFVAWPGQDIGVLLAAPGDEEAGQAALPGLQAFFALGVSWCSGCRDALSAVAGP